MRTANARPPEGSAICLGIMTTEMREKHIEALIRHSSAVLKAFRSGHSPTFEQLDRLESVLTPFTTDKLCGHRLDGECDCAELNRIKRRAGGKEK